MKDLVQAKKITQEQYDLYMLFNGTELGRKCLAKMTHEAFLEEPPKGQFKGVGFAFYSGRCSALRDIHAIINIVQKAIEENLND